MVAGDVSEVGRRRTEEVRTLILDAAHELFVTQGYDATTTEEIARKAGVQKPLIFTNFGNKAKLFDAAVVKPFAGLVSGYVQKWTQSDESSPDERVAALAEGAYDFAREHRTLLLSALSRAAAAPGERPAVLADLAAALRIVSDLEGLDSARNEYPDLDHEAITAVFGAMVFGLALLDDLIIVDSAAQPSRARLVREMSRTLLYGINRNANVSADESG